MKEVVSKMILMLTKILPYEMIMMVLSYIPLNRKSVRSMNLANKNHESIQLILGNIGKLTNLRSLNLTGTMVTKTLLQLISNSCSLDELILKKCNAFTSNCGVNNRSIKSLTLYNTLKTINLAYCINVGDIGVKYLATNFLHLRSVNLLGSINLTDSSIKMLSISCTKLTYINLSYCPMITDDGVKSLTGCTKLTYINLSDCPMITDEGVKSLIGCTELITVILDECVNVTETCKLELFRNINLKRNNNVLHNSTKTTKRQRI